MIQPPHPEVIVIGAGVSGLSSALRLLEAGFRVRVIARDVSPRTTSDVAAAIWYIYAAHPVERTQPWGLTSLREFHSLLDSGADCGLSLVRVREVFRQPVDDPWWRDQVRYFARLNPADLPSDYVDGFEMDLPVIETTPYLAYLARRVQAAGGSIEQRAITHLRDVYADQRLIVNCSGVWAGEVASDPAVFPIRGQVMRVARDDALLCGYMDDSDDALPIYIIPRSQDVVLGGTAQRGNWSLDVNPQDADSILERCARLLPAARHAAVLSQAVGLRPGRATVRLELEQVTDYAQCAVIHNYGHGGAGITLSWGCAGEVAHLARVYSDELKS